MDENYPYCLKCLALYILLNFESNVALPDCSARHVPYANSARFLNDEFNVDFTVMGMNQGYFQLCVYLSFHQTSSRDGDCWFLIIGCEKCLGIQMCSLDPIEK